MRAQYARRYIISASWEPLIKECLAQSGLDAGYIIRGTRYQPDFAQFNTWWYDEKLKVMRAEQLADFDLYTDSYDDQPLMRPARHVFLVRRGKIHKQLK